uniref:Thrombomodulin n=1 Tax=Elaeophora elaphi TaxID=1147741 RepID=A0A0R3RR28_9BILA
MFFFSHLDVDECASNEHFCSQKCINMPGGYECQCFGPLYKLARDGHRCYRTDSEPVLFFLAHSHNIWNITYNVKSDFKLMPSYGNEKVAINKVHEIQNHEVEGTEGVAVDWVHRNLYTLRQKQLHVQRLDGLYRASLYDGLFELPRALVAYPLTRALFASDWGTKPFIVRLAMDGTEAKKIITEHLVWPNALAIDYFAERLYWADAFRDTIEMANLDGTSRRVIIDNDQWVPHVFGLTVFDDMIVWSDWNHRAFLFADKLTGQNVTILTRTVLPPYSLKAYHSAMQMGAANVCEATTCQHICVPKSDGSGPQCLCAEGFILHESGLCEPNCSGNQLLCSRPDHKFDFMKCLSLIYRCDGLYNCGNGDDEMECPLAICKHDERMFPCRDNAKCILRSQRCDGFTDCADESDELYCVDLAIGWSH